jgi:carbon storage regulator CsrA
LYRTLRGEKKRFERCLLSKTARGKMAASHRYLLFPSRLSAGHRQASAWRGKAAAVIHSGSLAVLQKSRGGEMQMITRRVNEGLVIEDDIHVTVLHICRDYVRLAISSPNDTPPYREETLYWEEAEPASAPELLLQ